MNKTRLLIIAAPSGAGKNSLMRQAFQDFPVLKDVVTFTTRDRRPHEVHGVDYQFVRRAEFEEKIGQNFFAEWANVHDALYGTSRQSLEAIWAEMRVAIMDVDVQGVEKLSSLYPDAVTIFILPPSIEELKRRILSRDDKAPENLELRLRNAEKEIQMAHKFDYQVINEDFEKSYERFKKILEELL